MGAVWESPMRNRRLPKRAITVRLLVLSVLCIAMQTSLVWADAFTDRFQNFARERLQKPYNKAPSPCAYFWVSSGKDGYVVDMTPWAAASGLRRGDRPIAYGGIPMTGNLDTDNERWATMPRGDYVDIRVDRAGKELTLRLPCRDDRPRWEAFIAVEQAIAEGRWQDCLDAVSNAIKVDGIASAGRLQIALWCMRERLKLEKQAPPPDEYSRRIHAWATKAIEESHYRPTGLADVRGQLLNAIETLEKFGRKTLADDVRQQIATFTQAPPDSSARGLGKTVQRSGTAFVVRPDGFLLTAFHVVKDAKSIEISCPEIGNAQAWVERFSERNDVAVLRVAGNRTYTYLSIASPKSFSVGEQVFTIGYPAPDILGGEPKFTEGVISSLSVGGDVGYMQVSVPVQPGNSGGALINLAGDVVGVVIATASELSFLKSTGSLPQNVSWAVNAAFAGPLFDSPPPMPRTADRSAVIRRALKATCSVVASSEEVQVGIQDAPVSHTPVAPQAKPR